MDCYFKPQILSEHRAQCSFVGGTEEKLNILNSPQHSADLWKCFCLSPLQDLALPLRELARTATSWPRGREREGSCQTLGMRAC